MPASDCHHPQSVHNPLQSPLVKSKISKTQQSKFGGYAFSTPEGIEKVKQTNLEKYGETTPLLLTHVRDKAMKELVS